MARCYPRQFFILTYMAHMSKTTLYPNLWELCCFIAEVLGVGAKRAVYDNHKPFYECGYMPYTRRDKNAFCAIDVVKTLIACAQKRGKLGQFRESDRPLYYRGVEIKHSKDSYLESAKDLIWYYLCFVRLHRRKTRLDKQDMRIIFSNVQLRMRRDREWEWSGEKWDKYWAEVMSDYLEWCEEQEAREIFIETVVWFLGDSYRERCESHYDERFQETEYRYNDIKALLEKDLSEWNDDDKKKAFAVPFCGRDYENRDELYSLIFEKITREYRELSNGGRKHPTLIIDQYTELGYAFGWQCRPVLSNEAKRVLQMEPDDKDLDGFVAKLRLLKTPKEVDDLAENDVFNSVKDDLKDKIKVKGMGDLMRSNMALTIGTIPEDIAKQDPVAELNRVLDELESGSQEARFAWQVTASLFPILGATGYICEKKWKPYIPYVRQLAQKPWFIILLRFGIKVLNLFSKIKKIPEIW